MFGFEYVLAFMKIAINVGFAIVTAIPLYFAWNCIAPIYLSFIPIIYQCLPYWHIVGILLIVQFGGEMIQNITPKFISISQNNKV